MNSRCSKEPAFVYCVMQGSLQFEVVMTRIVLPVKVGRIKKRVCFSNLLKRKNYSNNRKVLTRICFIALFKKNN